MKLKNKLQAKTIPVDQAIGHILAHDITEIRPGISKGAAFKKGQIIRQEDIDHLRRLGKERLYILTLGNVEIRRGTAVDSIQVFLDGVLQQKAGAKITDSTGSEGSFCHHRDILLTFDDGTTMNLSELLSPSREILRTLYDSLHGMKLAKHIVDYIAISIYYHSHYQPG